MSVNVQNLNVQKVLHQHIHAPCLYASLGAIAIFASLLGFDLARDVWPVAPQFAHSKYAGNYRARPAAAKGSGRGTVYALTLTPRVLTNLAVNLSTNTSSSFTCAQTQFLKQH